MRRTLLTLTLLIFTLLATNVQDSKAQNVDANNLPKTSAKSNGNKIYYVASTVISVHPSNFNVPIVSNEWNDETKEGVITFKGAVTEIGDRAFFWCVAFSSVTLPDSVTKIGSEAFTGCSRLVDLYCRVTTPPTAGTDIFSDTAPDHKIYVPRGSVEAYKAADGWMEYTNDIVGYDF